MDIESTTRTLERLLRWEEAAGAAYERASAVADSNGDAVKLYEIRRDHQYAAAALRNLLLRLHAEGDLVAAGSAKLAARVVAEMTKIFGRNATFSSLERGEKVLQQRIRSALQRPELYPEACELLGNDLLPRSRDRVTKLERALAA